MDFYNWLRITIVMCIISESQILMWHCYKVPLYQRLLWIYIIILKYYKEKFIVGKNLTSFVYFEFQIIDFYYGVGKYILWLTCTIFNHCDQSEDIVSLHQAGKSH